MPVVSADHDEFRSLLERSTQDLAGLRIFDPEHPDRAVVAAGAPWFMTLFGRDSLLTSWMAMMVDPDLSLGTLQTLARFQGRAVNPLTEEEPGKILHEMRFGESAGISLGAGRATSTPFFPPPTGRSTGSPATATRTATATSSTSGPPTGGWSTRAGRT